MRHSLHVHLLFLILTAVLIPLNANAANISGGVNDNQHVSVADSSSQPTPPLHNQLSEQSYPGIPGGATALSGESGEQSANPASPHSEKADKPQQQVIDKDRTPLILATVALGISLALNIYLATSLAYARKRSI